MWNVASSPVIFVPKLVLQQVEIEPMLETFNWEADLEESLAILQVWDAIDDESWE